MLTKLYSHLMFVFASMSVVDKATFTLDVCVCINVSSWQSYIHTWCLCLHQCQLLTKLYSHLMFVFASMSVVDRATFTLDVYVCINVSCWQSYIHTWCLCLHQCQLLKKLHSHLMFVFSSMSVVDKATFTLDVYVCINVSSWQSYIHTWCLCFHQCQLLTKLYSCLAFWQNIRWKITLHPMKNVIFHIRLLQLFLN